VPKQIVFKDHMTSYQLHERWQNSRNRVERRRWRALYMISKGHGGAEVARMLDMSRSWVSKVVLEYNTFGRDWVRGRYRQSAGRKLALACDELKVILRHLDPYREEYDKTRVRHKINIKALALDMEDATSHLRPESTVRRYAKLVAHVAGVPQCVPGYKLYEEPTTKQKAELNLLIERCREAQKQAAR
jgi:transposase